MDSKEANVESAPAYSGVIPRNSLHQTQHESMEGPLRRGAEEKEDELSQRDQIDSDKELTAVKRNPEQTATKLQPNKKSKRRKHKKEKEKSQDGSGSFTVSDPPSRTSKRHSKKTHTKQEPSVFWGLIRFEGFYDTDASTTSKYLRCAPDTKAGTIWDIMINKWHMERPQLIISIFNDSDKDLTNKFQEKFKWFLKGLYTWIITNEMTASNDPSFTSDCKNGVVVMGVAPWGCVANRQALEGEEDQTYCLLPKEYSKRDAQRFKKNVILNESYSHFILIDDGTENKFGGEIDFRTNLEKFISEQSMNPEDKESSQTIPVISFIAGGGINTMKLVSQSVINGIPVLVRENSGGAADFIKRGMEIIKKDSGNSTLYELDMADNMKEEIIFRKTFDEEMKRNADEIFEWGDEDMSEFVDNCIMQLRQALQHNQLLKILESLDLWGIDKSVFKYKLEDGRSTIKFRLILALAWNSYDLPETLRGLEITNSEKLLLEDAMMTALKKNSVKFVMKFVENRDDLVTYFDIDNLWDFYKNCIDDENDVSAKLVNNLIKKKKITKTATSPEKGYLLRIEAVVNELYGSEMVHKSDIVEKFFVLTILMNRIHMARHFFKIGKDYIENALFASCLLKKLSKKAYDEDELELCLTFTEQSLEFEELASKILGYCCQKNRILSHQLLVRELSQFGTSLLCLAEENKLMEFLGQTGCQTKLSAIWKGRMALTTSRKMIVASIFMPFFIFAITFVDEKDSPVTKRGLDGKVAPSEHVKSKGGQNGRCLKWCNDSFDKLVFFYTAPVTKFITAMFANIVFLGLFSFFVLTDLHPVGENGAPSLVEIFIWTYTFTSVIEEISQIVTRDYVSIWNMIRSWSSSKWNRFDVVLYLLFLTSVILRLLLYGEDFIWARMLYSLTLGMFFFRFLQYFDADQNIGPKVTMISRMLTDLMFFLLILLVFMLSFGVIYQANLYPNAPQQWSILKDVLYHPYWQMYGELFLENIEGTDPSEEAGTCTKNETLWRSGEMDRCPEKSFFVVLLMAVYMLLTNVLLLNLLIALFSDTVKTVHDNSEEEWRFHRFSLVYEYANKPFLFPPLSLPIYMYWLIRWGCRLFFKHNKKNTSFRKKLDDLKEKELSLFQSEIVSENFDG